MVGETLSHFRIIERIGGGGMGEVYLAEDLELQRRVALKVLPRGLSANPDRLARFKREARAAAAINHPGVVTLHGVEEAGGTYFLTMELVEGPTLDASIPAGGLPLPRFFELALELVDAVWAAHQRGVVHRDLKPSNVMLTKSGRLKVLDFGLAKFDTGIELDAASQLVTEGLLTHTGQVIGTPYYMSPEQVEGKPTDTRSDLFSLGVILHQMAVGDRPFKGTSSASIMSAILTHEPPLVSEVRSELPRALSRIVRHCLEKESDRRFQTALDLHNELAQLAAELRDPAPSTPAASRARAAPGRRGPRRWLLWTALTAGVLILGLAALYWSREPPAPGSSDRPSPARVHTLRPLTVSAAVDEFPAYSGDGRQLAFSREVDGYRKVFALDLTTDTERQLTQGPTDDIQPAWSPDGSTLLFVRSSRPDGTIQISDPYSMHERGDIWRLELASGKLVRIAEEAFHPRFSPDGSKVAFYADWAGPERIWITDPFGRNPEQVTRDDSEQVSHLLPEWSPDGTKIVFQNNYWTTKFDIRVVDIATGEMRWVTNDGYTDVNPVWSADGRRLYFSSYRSGGMNIWRVPVDSGGSPSGPVEQITTGAGADIDLAISPDGSALAFTVSKLNADVWRLPLDPATARPTGPAEPLIVTTREDSRGAWSPDGTRVAFNSDRGGDMNLWLLTLADGSTRQLTHGPGGDYQAEWSPDGKRLAFFSARAGNGDVWTVDLTSGELAQLTDDPAIDINPFYSPDGNWIVFQSDRGGRREAWIMRSDGSEERQLTSNTFAGVHYFCWTTDSRYVLFNGAQGGAWRVPVEGGEPDLVAANAGGWHMSLSPDGGLILDNNHRSIQVTEARADAPRAEIFSFDDPSISIDYTVWSPDGRWVLFDRLKPREGDIWMLELAD
jgi:eukaryotic-like serine/threonine-protein kinase